MACSARDAECVSTLDDSDAGVSRPGARASRSDTRASRSDAPASRPDTPASRPDARASRSDTPASRPEAPASRPDARTSGSDEGASGGGAPFQPFNLPAFQPFRLPAFFCRPRPIYFARSSMGSSLVAYLTARADAATFLLPGEIERTIEDLVPRNVLPDPTKIFPADETQPPTLGFPLLETNIIRDLDAKLDRWLTEEVVLQVGR